MPKFENSQYAKIWDSKEGRQILTQILQSPDLIRANHTFWTTKFRVDPKVTPTDDQGRATFRSEMREIESGVLMDMRAPLGDATPAEKGNLRFYTGSIPDFTSKAYVETAMERLYKEKLFEQFGDAQLIAAYAMENLQSMIDSGNQTLSYMSAMMLSKGYALYNQGEGIQGPIAKADIPSGNFLTAGAVVWSDTTNCKILDQWRKMYDDVREKIGLDIAMQLEIPRAMFINYVLTNAQVISHYRYFKSLNNVLIPEQVTMTVEMAMEAINSFEGLPAIVIIEEKEKDINNGIVHGWDQNVAVLRPVGYAGYIRHTNIMDEEIYNKYGNSLIQRNYTPALMSLGAIENLVLANGNLKEWQSRLVMTAVPSLDEFLYHYIIDTTTADS